MPLSPRKPRDRRTGERSSHAIRLGGCKTKVRKFLVSYETLGHSFALIRRGQCPRQERTVQVISRAIAGAELYPRIVSHRDPPGQSAPVPTARSHLDRAVAVVPASSTPYFADAFITQYARPRQGSLENHAASRPRYPWTNLILKQCRCSICIIHPCGSK